MYTIHEEKGFTLLEVLVSFAVVLVISAMLPLFIKSLIGLTEREKGIHPLEVEVFVQQAKSELRNAKAVSVNESVFMFENNQGQVISYEWYDRKIRRRVNGSGHELMLHHVEAVTFNKYGNGVVLMIHGENEHVFEILIDKVPVE